MSARLLRRLAADRSASAGIIVALLMPALIGFAGLGTDYGYFFLDQRRLQKAVDMAALSAATMPGAEEPTARDFMLRNAEAAATLAVRLGSLTRGPDAQPVFSPGPGGPAVEVRAERPSRQFFSGLFLKQPPVLHAVAVATVQPTVSLAAGSRLAALSGGITQQITETFLGTKVDLKVLGYDGVLRSTIDGNALVDALADRVGVASGTLGALLDREISVQLLAGAVSDVLRKTGKPGPASDVARLALDLSRSRVTVSLAEILALPADLRSITLGTPSRILGADISVAGLLTAALKPQGDGSLLETSLALPGLVRTSLEMRIGEPMLQLPPLTITAPGGTIRTGQVRARLKIGSEGLVNALGVALDIPVELVVAGGEAKVVAATCSREPAHRSVTVEVSPGVARLEIGRWAKPLAAVGTAPEGGTAAIIASRALSVTAHAVATLRAPTPIRVVFTGAEIGNGTLRTVGSTKMVSGLVSDLLGSLTLDVSVLGIGLGLGDAVVGGLVRSALLAVASPLDTILDGVLDVAGVRLGTMDIRVDDLVCDAPKLAV
ncbi:pilus assembly protein TadG-related protein [Aureimonas sp. AU12]|uniref:pilus assembly protein TadG-related protein n=1 Tax=Aureimonas sp. AU12 TaxID=1638161 RepID=UPI00078654C1|nr:pilus assembly protein TadG-related protein [Aureimonas sp. AU12]